MQPLALFDLDDTLVDHRGAFNVWAEEFATAHRLDDRTHTLVVFLGVHHAGPKDTFFGTVCEMLDLPEPPDELWRQYRRRMPQLTRCRPEDADALQRLRAAGWRIGIVTNGTTDNQHANILNAGLDDLVDAWVISDEVGIRKPDPAIFQIAARRCGADPDRGGWMIGDSLVLDIAGGRAAGCRTIWLQPRAGRPSAGGWAFAGPAPDVIVDSAADAVEVLLHES